MARSQTLGQNKSSLSIHIAFDGEQNYADISIVSQRLKSALWFHIGKVVDEETINLGVNATPQFIGSLAELAWAQLGMCVKKA